MAEWSIAAVLKTVVLRGTGGSNPSLSAKTEKNMRLLRTAQEFFFIRGIRKFICKDALLC